MKVNIYYGGRGMIDDPTLAVLNRMISVLEELRVNVERYNLYELKNSISTLPQTLKEADAIILATTIEWYGIGGYMHSFLDACWQYGDKNKIAGIYMFPVVMAKAYGEREGALELMNAWDMLGGKSCTGLTAFVPEASEFDLNQSYKELIEKKTEEIYRTVSQSVTMLPTSNKAIKQNIVSDSIQLTQDEADQLSKYASNDNYVKQQKADIEELTGMFKSLLDEEAKGGDNYYIQSLQKHFHPITGFAATYLMKIEERNDYLIIEIKDQRLNSFFGKAEQADVVSKLKLATLEDILQGRKSFEKAFLMGEMTAKGTFKTIRMLDELFVFS